MSHIIAGRFEQQLAVEQAREALLRAGFSEDEVVSFYVNPPGQHDLYPVGGDRDRSPGAENSEGGLARGGVAGGVAGAVVGTAALPVLGPVGTVAGALVGAHVGDLIGSLNRMNDADEAAAHHRPKPRRAGLLLAVATDGREEEDRAISVLRSLHAADIERARGTIAEGDWTDFDPLKAPALVDEVRRRH